MAKVIGILTLLLLAGCGQWKEAANQGGDFCDNAVPHRHSQQAQAAMSDDELATETKHNEFGEKRCGWRARQ